MKLIGLTGLPRAGKNSVADRLVARHGFVQLAFADPLKVAASVLLDRSLSEVQGLNDFDREAVLPEWGFSMRWFLQRLGTECMREQIAQDFWIRHMRNKLNIYRQERVVITDARFENEGALIREMGGVVVRVTRPSAISNGHVSDKPIPFDFTLGNSRTLQDLNVSTDALVRYLGLTDVELRRDE